MADNNTPLAQDYSGVREYVGARYVPVFANPPEWSDTRGYEPLTIVLHEGNSYTSMQYVPTGIGIDNQEYWAETGNWNAQVEAYRQDVLAFNGRITNNEEDINSLQEDVSDIQKNKVVSQQNIVVLGDSFTDPNFDPTLTMWTDTLEKKTPYNYINVAVSGAGYGAQLTNRIYDQVSKVEVQANTVKMVIVYGGVNDVIQGTSADVYNAGLVQTFNNIRAKFGQVPILFVGVNGSNRPQIQGGIYTFTKQLARFCQDYNCMFFSGNHWLHWWNFQTVKNDNLHPTQKGQYVIAQQMEALIMGYDFNFPRTINPILNISDNTSVVGSFMFDGKNTDFTLMVTNTQVNIPAFTSSYLIGANYWPMTDNQFLYVIPGNTNTKGKFRSCETSFDSNGQIIHFNMVTEETVSGEVKFTLKGDFAVPY